MKRTLENKIVCEKVVEGFTFRNKKSYQRLEIEYKGVTRATNMIAPVDFFTIINAMVHSETIKEMINDFYDSWAGELLESMIENLYDEVEGLI